MNKTISDLRVNKSVFENKKFKIYTTIVATAIAITGLTAGVNSAKQAMTEESDIRVEDLAGTDCATVECNFHDVDEGKSIIFLRDRGKKMTIEAIAKVNADGTSRVSTFYLFPGKYYITGGEEYRDVIEFEVKDPTETYELDVNVKERKMELVETTKTHVKK